MTVKASLIRDQAEQLQDLKVSPERAAELATEVGRISAAVSALAPGIDFNDEPSRFLPTLRRLRRAGDSADD